VVITVQRAKPWTVVASIDNSGMRGSASTRLGAFAYDLFAGTPVYKPSDFPTACVTVGFQLTAQF
jgi:hemolysin activation/secretion protein